MIVQLFLTLVTDAMKCATFRRRDGFIRCSALALLSFLFLYCETQVMAAWRRMHWHRDIGSNAASGASASDHFRGAERRYAFMTHRRVGGLQRNPLTAVCAAAGPLDERTCRCTSQGSHRCSEPKVNLSDPETLLGLALFSSCPSAGISG